MQSNLNEVQRLRSELEKVNNCLKNIAAEIDRKDADNLEEALLLENSRLKSDLVLTESKFLSCKQDLEKSLEELKIESQKNLALNEFNNALQIRISDLEELNNHQTDKIKALRSVALALENENELISKERSRPLWTNEEIEKKETIHRRLNELETELKAKEEERYGYLLCFETMEKEKSELRNRLEFLEMDLIAVMKDRDQYKTSMFLSTDTLEALRQSKRLVENKFQAAIETVEKQSLDIQHLTHEKVRVEDELAEKLASLEALQHEFEVQATVYESTMNDIQSEIDKRLEEMTTSKDEDTEVLRQTFAQLFDEKARELNTLEKEYELCKEQLEISNRKLIESEYKEQELTNLLQQKNSMMETGREFSDHVEAITSKTAELESQVELLKTQYDLLQKSYASAIQKFRTEIETASSMACATSCSSNPDSSPQWIRDFNFNSEKSSTKKKRKKNRKQNGLAGMDVANGVM